MNTTTQLDRGGMASPMTLRFSARGKWWAATTTLTTGGLILNENVSFRLAADADHMIELENGDRLDCHETILTSKSSWTNGREIFQDLEPNDVGYLTYGTDGKKGVYIQAYVVWSSSLLRAAHSPSDSAIRFILQTASLPTIPEYKDPFRWRPGAENIIRLGEFTITGDSSR